MAQYVYTMRRVGKVVPPKRTILKNISLNFFPGAKIGVLGLNGSGKSSLLRIMAGVDDNYDGEVVRMPGIRVGFLEQEPQLPAGKSVRDAVEEGMGETAAAKKRLDEVYAAYSEPDADFDKLAEEQARLEALINAGGADELEVAADALRLPPWEATVDHLSGGEKRRVALCRLLLSKPDLLLLDEPTNHLDAESVEWLEQFLQRFPGHRGRGHARPVFSRQCRGLDPRARPRLRHSVGGQLFQLARPEGKAPAGRAEPGGGAHQGDAGRARVGAPEPERTAGEIQGAPRALRGAFAARAPGAQRNAGDLHPGGRAPRQRGDRVRQGLEGLRRAPAHRQALVPGAARRDRRHHRPQRRGQVDSFPHDHREGKGRQGQDQDRKHGEAGACRSVAR